MNNTILKRWTDLSQEEKNYIIDAILNSWENKNKRKEQLSLKFWITYWTINALIAHHTMKKSKKDWLGKEIIMESDINKEKVFSILSISWINEKLREEIYDEFTRICNENHLDKNYDFFLDIEALWYYHNIEPSIVEQYLRNRLPWLWNRLDSLKAWNITLSQENKSFIRKYVEEWINTSDKKIRRKEMANKFNVSIYVIWAITSWKNNWEKLVLSQDIEDNTIHQASQEIVNHEVSENIDYDVDFILELSREYNINSSIERVKFLEDIYDCYPEISIEDIKNIIHNFPDDLNNSNLKRNWEWSWVLLNYNNTIKNKWREKLKQFIDENTDKNDRKNLKVLCLPWIECLEIPLYLELWFSPENIILKEVI